MKRLKARRKKNKQNKVDNSNIISYSDLGCPPRFDQMSNITPEEHKASREAINDISEDTGVNIYDFYNNKDTIPICKCGAVLVFNEETQRYECSQCGYTREQTMAEVLNDFMMN